MNKNIALLIDVDNVKISKKAFVELYEKLNEMGEVVYCKFYGYNDRKHTYLNDYVTKYGYETAPFMRFKRRTSQLDNRIFVDAIKLNYVKPEINTYCIVAGNGDLVPLLVELKSSGRVLVDVNTEYQEINAHMFDENIVLSNIDKEAEVYTSKISRINEKIKEKPKARKTTKTTTTKTITPVAKPQPVKHEVEVEEEEIDVNLAKALRQITSRYSQLNFNKGEDVAKKTKLAKDIETLIKKENDKGEGEFSDKVDVREIFSDLKDLIADINESI